MKLTDEQQVIGYKWIKDSGDKNKIAIGERFMINMLFTISIFLNEEQFGKNLKDMDHKEIYKFITSKRKK